MENIAFENQDLIFFGLLLGVGLVLLVVSLIVRAKPGVNTKFGRWTWSWF